MKCIAYTLVEVLIAGSLLLIGIASAALLANSFFLQEEANAKITRAINLQEQAAHLYHLGLTPSTITNVLPEQCVASDPPGNDKFFFQFTTTTNTISGVGTVESGTCRLVFPAARQRDGTIVYATNDITVVRPTIR